MKQGTLDRPTFEAIEAYVLERMPNEERAAFERRMADDASLREEVELERENIQAVELGVLTRILKGMTHEDQLAEQGTTHRGRVLMYAAMVAAIVTGTIWWMTRAPLTARLYAENFTPDPGLPVTMGTGSHTAFADAMVAYKLGDHAEARAKWRPLLAMEPGNDTLRYYLASAWLSENNTAQAIPLLEELVQEPASIFNKRAQWYLLLAYLHDGETAKAQAIPLDNDPTYGDRVRSIKALLAR
jgi:Tetratricopeptide repeat